MIDYFIIKFTFHNVQVKGAISMEHYALFESSLGHCTYHLLVVSVLLFSRGFKFNYENPLWVKTWLKSYLGTFLFSMVKEIWSHVFELNA